MKMFKLFTCLSLILGIYNGVVAQSSENWQTLKLGKQTFELHNVTGEIVKFQGKKVLKIERDLEALPFDANRLEETVDETHYARLLGLDDFENGTIEVKMYSKFQDPSPYAPAAGFIGVYFRIKEDDSAFESIYLRPKVGRINNQYARNHAVQYFSYPDYKFQTLRDNFLPNEANLANKYVFDTLYRTTLADAELVTRYDKFFIKGRLTAGSASEILLPGLNISPGSVIVMAGNIPLAEGVDFTVDYNFGRVNIINEGILQSGKRISISFEKADLVSFQTRSLLGTRVEYILNEKFNIGGTLLYLNERPNITRIAIGNETLRNSMWGLDANFSDESRFLTKLADALPFTDTKEKSLVQFNAEFAHLIPGTSNTVDGDPASYIDDFEAELLAAAQRGEPHVGAPPPARQKVDA